MKKDGLFITLLFLLTIPAANWLIKEFGAVPVGLGLEAPAGVYMAGAALVLRDSVQRSMGRSYVVGAVLAGAALSYLIAPAFAIASATAFLASELADFAVFTALERRSLPAALLGSNLVGLLLDSYLFLSIAFGSLTFFWGQVVGKAWMGLLGAAVLYYSARRRMATS